MSAEKPECRDKRKMKQGQQSSMKYKEHKEADYKSAAQVGEDIGVLCGHSG